MNSGIAQHLVPMTGKPKDMASKKTFPQASNLEGMIKTEELRYNSDRPAEERFECIVNFEQLFNSLFSLSGNMSQFVTTFIFAFGCSCSKDLKAERATSKPFLIPSFPTKRRIGCSNLLCTSESSISTGLYPCPMPVTCIFSGQST